ncbi:hypothetical protein OZ664_10110 [Elizabethkingia sp. HX WHF]|uniref:Uncharacterized protein n=1 Tax=Elizabethkingia bruuniana TaxID=1756149 RepID=A0A7T7ZX24_9FLAO|nr:MULTISPECIES: hypothetical protein [Elizabethkingia]ATL43314.1 hypothetical protein CQS02_08365 [Elizabethkingia miricola]AQX84191.1 hypothetical protein AYC65_03765 [Elizabethkingia bruuniana]KGO10119.1 hypothetical protein KS04_10290 [Elizabethkingia miricola]KUY28368.1 hypothetical protein ATB97_15760 [Elizabethkingia bruuniana]MDX8564353.1 hypothetical protein [Elizabethkingia sp. HX WHF]
MKKLNYPLALSIVLIAVSANVKAQDKNFDSHSIAITIPKVALVDIEPAASKNLTLAFTAPTEAGQPLTAPTPNSTLWLNYSSIKSQADTTRNVTVKLTALVPGVDIKVTAAAATGSGGGTLGTPSAQLILSAADQTIITGIGSAYTGDGANNGHNLTYALNYGSAAGSVASYSDLDATATATATVTYTISDN